VNDFAIVQALDMSWNQQLNLGVLSFFMQIHSFSSSPIPLERIKMLRVNYNIRMATSSKHLANNLQVISTIQSFFFHFLKACCEVQQDDSSSSLI
jgi:hypothetical protein